MASSPVEGLNMRTVEDLRKRIMWSTRIDAAILAHYLGYGWCYGVNGLFPGDDMLMEGDSWIPNMKKTDGKPVEGFKSDQRLKITYGHWRYKMADIRFDAPIIDSELRPERYFDGILENDTDTDARKTVSEEKKVLRRVTNRSTDDFSWGRELGLSITYKAPTVSGSVDFKFNESNKTSSTDTTGTTQEEVFTIQQYKDLKPYTAAKWHMQVSASQTNVPYTAVVVAEFSLTFDGFLRWGGKEKKYTNFHKDYYGSEERPTVPFTFGGPRETFTEALQDQSSARKVPWLWEQAKKRYPELQDRIDELLSAPQYSLPIDGAIEDIRAMHSTVTWTAVDLHIEN